MRQQLLASAILALLLSAPGMGAECAAAQAMAAGTGELEQRKSMLQRREWLLLEYLSSDGSKKSRKLFDAEVAKSQERTTAMLAQLEPLHALPAGTPDVPEDGTPACATITQAKTAIDSFLDAREKELLDLTGQKFPFLKACDDMSVKLVSLAATARKEGASPKDATLLKLTLDLVLGPQIRQARMPPDAFGKLTNEVFAAGDLSPRALVSYAALRCLRTYQRADIKTLAEASDLAQCPTPSWIELGQCAEKATRRQ